MNSTEVRLDHQKSYKVSYKVHYVHCTEESTCKNSRNYRKVSTFFLKKASIQWKNG